MSSDVSLNNCTQLHSHTLVIVFIWIAVVILVELDPHSASKSDSHHIIEDHQDRETTNIGEILALKGRSPNRTMERMCLRENALYTTTFHSCTAMLYCEPR